MKIEVISYVFFGIITGVILTINISKYLRKRNFKKKMQKAKKSEHRAVKFLENKGYQILDFQKKCFYTLYIDNKPYKIEVKADLIVKKGNKNFVAEVKTGEKVTSPKYTGTRRQLLEYYMAYRPDGLILVDMERQKIRTIKYSILRYNKEVFVKRLVWVSTILFLGFIMGFLTRGG